jgi:(2Fe-2S) ferredoxin
MKARAKELGLTDVRINTAGCLDRCAFGPTMVVYPDGTWYHYASFEDIEEILNDHLIGGQVVQRLRLPAAPAKAD